MKRHGFKRPERLPRHPAQAPLARLHRRVRHPGPGVQGRADGGPDGRRADHRAVSLTVHAVDAERGLLLIKGAVPGPAAARGRWSAARSRTPARSLGVKPDDRAVSVISPSAQTARPSSCRTEIFAAKVNVPLIHQVVVAQQAAARQGTHATKTRGVVRGGGKKPYRQKGTGRARQGSTRAPQFAGGGVAHGPVPRSYAQRTPKKMKAAALRGALSDRAAHGRVHVVSGFVDGDVPRTKDARGRAGHGRPMRAGRPVLVVARRTTTRSPGSRCATCPACTCSPRTSSTPTTCWPATTWSSPRQALDAFVARTGPRRRLSEVSR